MLSITELLNPVPPPPKNVASLQTLSRTVVERSLTTAGNLRSRPAATITKMPRELKGPWKPSETALLSALVARYGPCRWTTIAAHIPGRTGKQARERWKNHLDPRLKKGGWTTAEDSALERAYRRLGNKWSAIARLLPGRSDNDVKNRFNGSIRARTVSRPRPKTRGAMQSRIQPLRLWDDGPQRARPTMFDFF